MKVKLFSPIPPQNVFRFFSKKECIFNSKFLMLYIYFINILTLVSIFPEYFSRELEDQEQLLQYRRQSFAPTRLD